MKKGFIFLLLASVLTLSIAMPKASAQTTDVNYQVNQPDSNSASIANDYFLKPAKVTENSGSSTVQLTLKNSAWITKFEPPGGATVVSEDKAADTRVVQFTVSDLTQPVKIAMKVDVDEINYHHEYTVSLVFEKSNATAPPAATDKTDSKTPTATDKNTSSKTDSTTTTGTVKKEPNPQTGDSLPYLLLIMAAGSALLLVKSRMRKQGEQQS